MPPQLISDEEAAADDDLDPVKERWLLAQNLFLGGQPAQAAQIWEDIGQSLGDRARHEEEFDRRGIASFLYEYAGMQRLVCDSTAKLKLGAVKEATIGLQKALAICGDRIEPLLNNEALPSMMRQGLQLDKLGLATMLDQAKLMQDLREENFSSAERRSGLLQAKCDELLASCRSSVLPEPVAILLTASAESGKAMALVWATFANAEHARQSRDWTKALAGYDVVDEQLLHASAQLARISAPVAVDAQLALMNSALLPTARRRLEENRRLLEEGEHRAQEAERANENIKQHLVAWQEILKGWSPTIIARTEVTANVNVITQVINVAQQRLSDDLAGLARAIEHSALPEGERVKLVAEIGKLKATKNGDGESYFKKVAEFVENSASLLEGLGKAAEPVGKVVQWVAPYITTPGVLALLGFLGLN